MSPEVLAYLGVLTSTVGGCIIALINYLDRRDQRRAELAKGSAANLEAARPTRLPASGAMVLCLFACSYSLFGLLGDESETVARSAPVSRRCSTAADCEPPQRCRAGICEADAHKRPTPRPSLDDESWSLLLVPRMQQADPILAPLEARDVILRRREW